MAGQRQKRVSGMIQLEISEILRTKMKDPRLGFVTVTQVALSADLRNARVYVSILGSDEERAASMHILEGATSFIQSELGTRIRLRYLPMIKFFLDTSLDYMEHINEIFNEIHSSDKDTIG
ncbi:30S ribosome-binding factor RbfA [bacterium]|nr:30S ribosome-binding factor RbfA [bacterium]